MQNYNVTEIVTLLIIVFNFIWAVAVIPWLVRISKVEEKLESMQKQLSIQYMQKTDFENHLLRIENSLSKIQDYMMSQRQQ